MITIKNFQEMPKRYVYPDYWQKSLLEDPNFIPTKSYLPKFIRHIKEREIGMKKNKRFFIIKHGRKTIGEIPVVNPKTTKRLIKRAVQYEKIFKKETRRLLKKFDPNFGQTKIKLPLTGISYIENVHTKEKINKKVFSIVRLVFETCTYPQIEELIAQLQKLLK